ncbi:MAG: SDR family oxidoreductase [Planctomycetota bacterium]
MPDTLPKSTITSFDLQNQVAVVTGGSGFLCSAMAKCLAAHGAKVAVLARHAETLAPVVNEIQAAGGTARAVVCDVLDVASCAAAVADVTQALGPADILINGAGGNNPKGTTAKEAIDPADFAPGAAKTDLKTFFDLPFDGIQSVFNLNFLGTLLPTQAFGRAMVERKRGTIVNVSSMAGLRPLTKIAAYSAAKAAVINFTQWLSVHFAPAGVRVNALAPGFFLADQNRFLLIDEKSGQLTPRGKKIIDHTPMGRFGEADDLLGAVLFLASPMSQFVTGAVLPIDGGFAAYSGV